MFELVEATLSFLHFPFLLCDYFLYWTNSDIGFSATSTGWALGLILCAIIVATTSLLYDKRAGEDLREAIVAQE